MQKMEAGKGLWSGSSKDNGNSRCCVVIKGVDWDTWVTISRIALLLRVSAAMAAVNNCAHSLAVLVLCVFGTCRAFLVPAEVFVTWCPHVDFSCAPVFVCLKGP